MIVDRKDEGFRSSCPEAPSGNMSCPRNQVDFVDSMRYERDMPVASHCNVSIRRKASRRTARQGILALLELDMRSLALQSLLLITVPAPLRSLSFSLSALWRQPTSKGFGSHDGVVGTLDTEFLDSLLQAAVRASGSKRPGRTVS